MTAPIVELIGLSKSFNTVAANAGVELRVQPGSIHAIIGENGAGKSTAMKMLYGVYTPDSGEIRLRGKTVRWRSPSDAIRAGIGMVHQHFMLADPYTALENVVVGEEDRASRLGWLPSFLRPIGKKSAQEKLNALSRQYGLNVDWELPVESLSVGVQQRLEILKLLYRDAEVLILDEPTAVLTPQETQEFFKQLKKLASEGKTILIITHKLKEVMALTDRVTVFRAGKSVAERETKDTSMEELASLMVGRKMNLKAETPPAVELKEPVLEIQGLSFQRARSKLENINLTVRGGEVVGIAGVEGNGQSELLRALLHPEDFKGAQGKIRILGTKTLGNGVFEKTARIKDLGVGLIPEDRHRQRLLLEASVKENFLLGLERDLRFQKRGFVSGAHLDERVRHACREFDIRPPIPELAVGRMSGGNQQKVIIAREFEREPQFLIAAQPTRGVDIGAVEFIHQRILKARASGSGVLLISSELDEILALSDRVLVIFAGKIVAEFMRGESTEQSLGIYMGGGSGAA